MTPRVRFDRVSKSFGGTRALNEVSFDLAPGCVHALVGENGAGKSTLIRILAGASPRDAGSISIDGREWSPVNPRQARQAGIAVVYQELSIVPHLSVAENVFLGRWPRRLGIVDFASLHAASAALFVQLGIDLPHGTIAGSLSIAQQQMVEIARALSMDARVLVLDEPSAVLTPKEVGTLFGFVRSLTARGVSVLYISHRFEEVFALADWVTVLCDGRHISTRPIAQVTREGLIRDTVGRDIAPPPIRHGSKHGEPVLVVRGLTSRSRFENITFDIRAGEIFGLAGLVGSGRTSIARAIFGAARVDAGAVRVTTTNGPFTSPKQAQRAGIALIPEDRKREGLLTLRPLRENLTLAHLHDHSCAGILRAHSERSASRRLIDGHRIKSPHIESPVITLSGGNQQKALIARWLAKPYSVVILDEPTRGVDIGAKSEIHAIIRRIACAGAAVLIISSELPEIIALCDGIGVMRRGKLVGTIDNSSSQATQAQIMELAIGASAA
jgi:ABC-type sugar transport system ATPase subunit